MQKGIYKIGIKLIPSKTQLSLLFENNKVTPLLTFYSLLHKRLYISCKTHLWVTVITHVSLIHPNTSSFINRPDINNVIIT